MKTQLKTILTSFLLLIALCFGAFAAIGEKHALGDFSVAQQYIGQNPEANQLASLESFGFYQKHASECCNAPNRGIDDLISGGRTRSANSANDQFPDGYSPPYTPGTRVTEFVSDGNQTFVRVVSGDQPGGQWVMRQSDIAGLIPAALMSDSLL